MQLLFMAGKGETFEVTALPPMGEGKKKRHRVEVKTTSEDKDQIKVNNFLTPKHLQTWLKRQKKKYEKDGYVVSTLGEATKTRQEAQLFNGITLNSCNVVDMESSRVIMSSKEQTNKPKENLAIYASLTVPIEGTPKIVGVLLREDKSFVCAGRILDGWTLSIKKQIEVTLYSQDWMRNLVKKVRAFLLKLQEIKLRYKVQRAAFVGRNIDDCDNVDLASSVKQEFTEGDFRVNEDALVAAVKFGRILIV